MKAVVCWEPTSKSLPGKRLSALMRIMDGAARATSFSEFAQKCGKERERIFTEGYT